MNRLVKIGEAAKALGVSISTLRRWQKKGKLKPVITQGGHRRYDLTTIQLQELHVSEVSEHKTIAYACVSSPDQKDDLERQKQVLELYCAKQGWMYEIISDFGSGMNYHKKGLKQLLDAVLGDRVRRLVITHKDRLLRLGAELVFSICEAKGVEVIILNKGEDSSFEEDFARDLLEIMTLFSARLYGSRSRRIQKILEACTKAIEDNACAECAQN